jgi:hypothetical protein
MKSKVLDRPMFKKGMMAGPMEEVDPENVGIMSGFKDMLIELELPEDEEDGDTAEMMGRTPDSPEILMNNLRGDMRSVDARKEELADLVGMQAASETPDSVLALLQPVLAGQAMPAMGAPAGAPGLPPPAPPEMMPPPGGMPMPPMPPAPPMPGGGIGELPTAQGPAPVQMRNGGIVQRFKDGTLGPDEDQDGGVSPVDVSTVSYPEDMVERARTETYNFLARRPSKEPSLEEQLRVREPMYQRLLGSDKNLSQAQMLFDIAQAGLNLSAGVDAEGRPLRGAQSPVSRFAAAFSKVPAQIGARAGEAAKEDRAIKLAAIQAAEKDIENIRKQNTTLIESQRKAFSDIVKSSGSGIFGKGDWHWNVVNKPGLLANWAAGKTSAEQDNLVESAITEFENQSKPIVETRTDPDTSLPYQATRPGKAIPPFVIEARKARSGLTTAVEPRTTDQAQPAPVTGTTGIVPGTSPAPGVRPGATPTMPVTGAGQLPGAPGGGPGTVPMQAGELPGRTLWSVSGLATGPVSSALGGVSGTPGLGDPFPLVTQARNAASQEVENLIEAFIKNQRAAMGEQERLRKLYSVGPKFWDDPAAYRSRLVSIDEEIGREMNKAASEAYNDQLPSTARQQARNFLNSAERFRSALGVPLRIYSEEDSAYKELPDGVEYLWQGVIPYIKGGARGRR